MFRRDELAVDALDVSGIVVGVNAERRGGGGEALGRALLRLVRVHRHLERAPVLDAELQLLERHVLHNGARHEVRHPDGFLAHRRELGLDGGDALDLVGADGLLLGLGDVAADGPEELLGLRTHRDGVGGERGSVEARKGARRPGKCDARAGSGGRTS